MKLASRPDFLTRARLPIVLLAGALRPSPLRQRLDVPVLCLPLTPTKTLLDLWLRAIRNTPGELAVTIVVNSLEDAERIRGDLDRSRPERRGRLEDGDVEIEVVVDPAPWRGPGGLIYDIAARDGWSGFNGRRDGIDTAGGDGAGGVIVAEAACVPPQSLEPLSQGLAQRGVAHAFAGVSGVSATAEPAGLYAFSDEVIRMIPPVGYCDLKEQLLPELYARGRPIPAVRVVERTLRLWDRESYIEAAGAVMHSEGETSAVTLGPGTHVVQPCLFGADVVVGDGAIVHGSVLFDDVTVGRGAVISRSVIAAGRSVPDGAVVRGDVIGSDSVMWTNRWNVPRLRRGWFAGGSEKQ